MALDAGQAARVDAAVREVTDAEALKKRARAHGGWDSHTLVQVIFAIEEAFGLVFSSREMEAITDRPSLEAVLERRLSGRAP